MRLRRLSADDIFISYSRKDAATYALGLADALMTEGFSCFLDRLGTEADQSLPASLIKKLKNCDMLIVVGTPGACDSEAIARELFEFSQVNGTSRIVPVDFGGATQSARWQPQIVGIAVESEAIEALADGNPAPRIIKRIEKAFNYTRGKQRLRRYSTLAALLLTTSVLASAASFFYAREQLTQSRTAKDEARAQRLLADSERARADGEREAASRATQEADAQAQLAHDAEGKRLKAEAETQEAKYKTSMAEAKAGDALRQQQVAEAREREATASAERQEKISNSARLASQGARRFGDQLDLGLVLNAEALSVYDTYEARNGLLSALQHSPRLLAYLDVGLRGVRRVEPSARFSAFLANGLRGLRWRTLRDAVLSADEKTFASRNVSDVTVWDVASSERILSIGIADKEIASFALSPNGRLLALGSYKKVFLWDVKARRELPEISISSPWATEMIFDPTGKYLAFVSLGIGWPAIYVIAMDRMGDPMELPYEKNIYPKTLAFSVDGMMLAAAGVGVRVWDMSTMAAQNGWPSSFTEDEPYYDYAAFSPDGKVLVTASGYNDKIVTWDVSGGKRLRQFDIDTSVSSATFNYKGNLLAFGGEDGTIRLWDTDKMEEVERLSAGRVRIAERLTFTKDDRKLISVGEEVLVWDMSDNQHLGQVIGKHQGPILNLAYSPDGKYLASCAVNDGPVILRDAHTGKVVVPRFKQAIKDARRLCFSRDGKVLAIIPGGDSFAIQVWDINQDRLINTIPQSSNNPYDMELSPDGKLLAVWSLDLTLWDTESGRQRGADMDPTGLDKILRLTFSPDGSLLAFGTNGGNILLVDTRTLKQVARMSITTLPPNNDVLALAFSPDGRTLASNGPTGEVILWDVASHARLRELIHPGERLYVSALAFSADGKMLAVGTSRLGDPPASLENPIFLWDTETYQPLGEPLSGHLAPVSHLAFSPGCDGCFDGARLVSGSDDGTVIAWDLSVASWQRRACAMTNRRLTDEERGFYFRDPARHQSCLKALSFASLTAQLPAEGQPPEARTRVVREGHLR